MYGFKKVPVLSKGAHTSPEEGMCIMELVSFINREPFCDSPHCTDDRISAYMQNVNDTVTDEERVKLLSVLDRMFHTGALVWEERRAVNEGLQNLWPELRDMVALERTQYYHSEAMTHPDKLVPSHHRIWDFLYHVSMSEESVDVKLVILNKVLDVMDKAMGVEETLPQNREVIEEMLAEREKRASASSDPWNEE